MPLNSKLPAETTKPNTNMYLGEGNKSNSKYHTRMDSSRKTTEYTANWMDYLLEKNNYNATHGNYVVNLWSTVVGF